MNMQQRARIFVMFILSLFIVTSCSFNPFISNNHTTGSPAGAAIGAGVGAGSIALLGGSKPLIVLAGLGGGAIGYYVTTLRYDSGGVISSGGQVYQIGDYVGINIPTDKLFEPNTADFLPGAANILDSAADVLARNPNNNIIISGNTSGFARNKREQKLSEQRAQRVSAYLWNAGINNFKTPGNDTRKLNFVGYGNYLPISQDYTNDGIRQNSHIQITSYPTNCDLHLNSEHKAFNNVGAMNDDSPNQYDKHCLKGECEGTNDE
jgi:outer membrane protein OmpA-like peptidoglycan-associated protein